MRRKVSRLNSSEIFTIYQSFIQRALKVLEFLKDEKNE